MLANSDQLSERLSLIESFLFHSRASTLIVNCQVFPLSISPQHEGVFSSDESRRIPARRVSFDESFFTQVSCEPAAGLDMLVAISLEDDPVFRTFEVWHKYKDPATREIMQVSVPGRISVGVNRDWFEVLWNPHRWLLDQTCAWGSLCMMGGPVMVRQWMAGVF